MTHPAVVLHMRLSRLLPLPLKRSLHPAELQRLCQQAVDNGWTDPEWLAGIALEGIDHPTIASPAAVVVARLRTATATPCPGTGHDTPTPPAAADLAHDPRIRCPDPLTDPHRIRAHLHACRTALRP